MNLSSRNLLNFMFIFLFKFYEKFAVKRKRCFIQQIAVSSPLLGQPSQIEANSEGCGETDHVCFILSLFHFPVFQSCIVHFFRIGDGVQTYFWGRERLPNLDVEHECTSYVTSNDNHEVEICKYKKMDK